MGTLPPRKGLKTVGLCPTPHKGLRPLFPYPPRKCAVENKVWGKPFSIGAGKKSGRT